MGLYEDQLAKIQRTQDFLDRQIDLSDDNKVDVIEALLNTENQFFIAGEEVTRDQTSINLDTFLRERGIDPDNLPDEISGDIFKPTKLTEVREISKLVPSGEGIDLTALQKFIEDEELKAKMIDLTFSREKADSFISSEQQSAHDAADQIHRPTQFFSPTTQEEIDFRKNQRESLEGFGNVGALLIGVMLLG